MVLFAQLASEPLGNLFWLQPCLSPDRYKQIEIDRQIDRQIDRCAQAKSLQLYPTLCNPMDCILPCFSVHEILQARILEWVAMPSSRGSFQPRDQTQVSCISCTGRQVLYHQCHLRSPNRQIQRYKIGGKFCCDQVFHFKFSNISA